MRAKINYPRLAVKTLLCVLLISLVILPVVKNSIGKLSLYNWIIPGRERLPFSDTPQLAYNLSLFNLDANLASHAISERSSPENEFRVILLGDSSTWGTLLKPEETLAGQLNQMELSDPDGTPLHFYNFGYPTLSLTKDLLLLERALAYKPDLIIWLFTLESFPDDKQLTSPLVENNPQAVSALFDKYNLDPRSFGEEDLTPSYWESTLFGQRRNLADILRLQLYGVMWAITGIDQYYPAEYTGAARDLSDEVRFHGWEKGEMTADQLALEILAAGKDAAGKTPLIYVNEPILVSQGENSDLRYNFYYPRWAYDQYRRLMSQFSTNQDLNYLDYWDLIPGEEFTNTAIHVTPEAVNLFAKALAPQILLHFNP